MSGWRLVVGAHIIPDDDLVEHEESPECVCGPTEEVIERPAPDGPFFNFIHHSLDGRELEEAA